MRRAAPRNSRSAPLEVSRNRSAVPVDAICEGRGRERVRGRRPKSGWRDERGVNDYARASTERGGERTSVCASAYSAWPGTKASASDASTLAMVPA